MPCIRICKIRHGLHEILRQIWDEWDMRFLVVCILCTQLYLHILGQRRRKSTMGIVINVNVWFLYLLADLLATIALGKFSKVKGDSEDISSTNQLRGLWASIIFFCLGGPDSMTILRLEETEMWLKQLIGLLTQGLRISIIMFLTWNTPYKLSLLALLMLFSGFLKYGERVWVIKSRAKEKNQGFVQLNHSTINNSIARAQRPNVKLVLKAYSCFQTLKPHILDYECNKSELHKLINEFREWVVERGTTHNTFKLVEIELGLMYDIHFSKVGTIFTLYGSMLRLISFSCIVSVLVGFFLFKNPPEILKGDIPITIFLLVGALVLEIAGVLVQLGSDWAIVWACKNYSSKLTTPVFHLHELVISKSKRWSELMGQFSLLHFCSKNKPEMFCNIVEDLFGRENALKKFSLSLSPVQPSLKELVLNQLRMKPKNVSEAKISNDSNIKIGEWTLRNYGYLDAFEWIIDLEFEESILIWHVATDVCYHSELEDPKLITDEVETTKILSYYMMHLLLICPSSLPICDDNDMFNEAYTNVKKFFEGDFVSSIVEPYKLLLENEWNTSNLTINKIRKLSCGLMEKENRWKIMSNVWVEMLCYAASQCPVKHHVQELRNGGQFVTHVWLLLMHLGETKKNTSEDSMDEVEVDNASKGCFETLGNIASNLCSSS